MREKPIGLAVAILLSSAHADAFRTAGGQPPFKGTARVRWEQDRVSFVVQGSVPNSLTVDAVERTAGQAFAKWSDESGAGIDLMVNGRTTSTASPGDGVNTIQFLAEGWAQRGWDPTAAGLTDVQYIRNTKGDWTIAEADIYLNAENHAWMVHGAARPGYRDLDSVLTHEAGHAMGLMHPCEIGGVGGAPDCALDPAYALVTMYPEYKASQAQLSNDDVAGVRFLYPNPTEPPSKPDAGVCESSDGASPVVVPTGAATSCRTEVPGEKLPMGATCSSPEQCQGGECLSGADHDPVCTRRCGAGAAECPASWFCDVVQQVEACRPIRFDTGGGCAVARGPVAKPAAFPVTLRWAAFLLFGAALLRARGRMVDSSQSVEDP